MKIETIRAKEASKAERLDTRYFLASGRVVDDRAAKLESTGLAFGKLGSEDGFSARVWSPGRFKRAYAAKGESSVPYLRPHDVFCYLPEAADYLSEERTEKIEQYRLKPGTILLTCSGRNLGPAVLVDKWLARFALSHDMLRIDIEDSERRAYVLAYLRSATGQGSLRRNKTGSVIDHLTDAHVAAQEIPLLDDATMSEVARRVNKACRQRERARIELNEHVEKFTSALPSLERRAPMCDGWTVKASALGDRIDAAFHDPLVSSARKQLKKLGGVRVGDVAKVAMLGRYKRQYATRETGRPILSGAQLLQCWPINLRYISATSFDDVDAFELRSGWLAYPADGRAEEALGTPVVITADRDRWLASNMVGRIVPNEKADLGWLYLALRSEYAQLQIKSCASGSVIDHTYPWDMERVILPKVACDGRRVVSLWNTLANAQRLEDEASALVDTALAPKLRQGGSAEALTKAPAGRKNGAKKGNG